MKLHVKMNPRKIFLLFVAVNISINLMANEEHEHSDDLEPAHEHESHEEHSTKIDNDIALKVGISTDISGPQTINQNILSYGNLSSGPEQLSHIRARYSGLIKSVKVSIGDEVNAGDLLAIVESNESLREYKITSPIAGTVVQRHANTGEVTQEQILFSVANFATLWAELRIYPAQRDLVKAGQNVHFHVNKSNIVSNISHVIPTLDHPYQLARIKINNDKLGLSPGLLIEGNIAIKQLHVPVAVTQRAVQTLDGAQGIFIKHDSEYIFQTLILGESDHDFIEVIDGLEAGIEYVSNNSYLIKADIEKSEAGHHH